jgi:hypothetical protein
VTEVLQLVDDLFAALDAGSFDAGAEALERLDEWRQRQREPQNGPELAEAAA